MLNVEHREGGVEVSDGKGRAILITEDDLIGGMIVTFPGGARTSGMAPFAFAFEDDMRDVCAQKFHLAVRVPDPHDHLSEDCGCP